MHRHRTPPKHGLNRSFEYGVDPIHYARWFPELALFPGRAKRGRAFRKAANKCVFSVRGLSSLALYLWGVLWALPYARSIVHLPPLALRIIGIPLLSIAAAIVVSAATRATARRSLRSDLTELGIRICVNCGYDLRGSNGDCCPECSCKSEGQGNCKR